MQQFLEIVRENVALICHQEPDRSFQVWETASPFCSRCTGIYTAIFLYVGLILVWPKRDRNDEKASLAYPQLWRSALIWLSAGVGLVSVESVDWLTLSLFQRALAGGCLGIAFVLLWSPIFDTLLTRTDRSPPTKLTIVVLGLMTSLGLFPWTAEIYVLLSLAGLVALGIILFGSISLLLAKPDR